jgi:transglutaminase/protease-like cytokinesis protein 3
MPRDRKYREWQNRSNIYRKSRRKRSNLTFWLWLIMGGLSIFVIIKNNPQPIKGLFNVFNFNISSIQSITDPFITDIDEKIIPGPSENINENQFSALDKQAKSLKYYGNSVRELANLLSQHANTDLEKARLIYTWITHNIAYDSAALFALKSGVYPDVRVENVLNRRKTICSGYANLYQKIADAMGLKSVIVLGYARGLDYIVGENQQINHAWNAVKIDEKWYLIDTTWGAGKVTNNTFNQEFNPLYFATPPDELIYSHFPQQDKWQLLGQPYTRQQFNLLPEVSGALFSNNLELISHKTKTIYTNNNLNITLKAPQDVVAIANLKSENSELKDNYTLVQNKDGYITVKTTFPAKGNYTLDIFAKKRDNSNYYPHVVTYQIRANNSSEQFPFTYSDFLKNNGYLETPLTKSLNPNQFTYFKLRVDNATEVKVIDKSSNNSTDLIKYGNLFAGNVRIGSGKVIVFAKFPEDSRYWALLEYN